MEDPAEVRLPTDNRLLVVPRMKKSRDFVTSTLLDDLLLYFCDSPAIGKAVSRGPGIYTPLFQLTSSIGLSHRARAD